MVTNLYIMSYNKNNNDKALNKILTLSVQHNHMVCYYELLHNKHYGPLKLFSQDVTELLGDHLIGRPHCQTIHL